MLIYHQQQKKKNIRGWLSFGLYNAEGRWNVALKKRLQFMRWLHDEFLVVVVFFFFLKKD